MGMYLNPGKTAYEEAIHSEVFIDKSEMILFLNSLIGTKRKYASVSRPRRFGKTTAADMIAAYYDAEADSRELFEGLNISGVVDKKWDEYLGKYDVIRLVMTDFFKRDRTVSEALDRMQRLVIREIKGKYPDKDYFDDNDLIQTLEDVYGASGSQIIIIIDEWDAVFRVSREDNRGQTEFLDFLRNLFKDKQYIALAYMTGILPIKKYGEHSALNMFTEYSMTAPMQMARFTGFTEEEVKKECDRFGRDFDKVKAWYDGYVVSDVIPPDPGHAELKATGKSPEAVCYSLYCPLSVVEAMITGVVKDYWNKTETYEALAEYIRKDFDGLKDAVALLMDGGRVRIDTSTYQNDMMTFTCRDDVLSLLIHLGYLGFDDTDSEVFIPNREILDEFKTSTKTSEWEDYYKAS